ncbi:MAG TPA: hypothetical protein VEY93_07310 [Longimicrobium sp.]|nr:hypothetical protein [Longimicrobium sp.]
MKASTRGRIWKALGPFQGKLMALGNFVYGPPHLEVSARPATFDDRGKGRSTMLIVLAGHKPALWSRVFPRIAAHTDPEAVDICVVCSGGAPAAEEARRLAAERGWSFMQAEEDLLAHAQNLAVRCFPRAEWIAKLDEDMFPTAGWLEGLRETYARVEADGRFRPGIVAPVIPVNGYGYRQFLELTGQLDDYAAAFPQHPPVSAGLGVAASNVPEIAEWIWRRSHPLDGRARELARFRGEYSICPHHFSIGAFLMHRGTFDDLGGFAVAPVPGLLGYEEHKLCVWCMSQSRAVVVAHGSLVGHFAFGPQWAHMNTVLQREPALFD